ncbi:MAG: choice-of-anchor Q domain-containing protein, partial [Spirochaetota bacterium]
MDAAYDDEDAIYGENELDNFTFNITGDPLFVDIDGADDDIDTLDDNDWHLTAGSPAADAGAELSADYVTDHDEVPRTVPWSIGAYELD